MRQKQPRDLPFPIRARGGACFNRESRDETTEPSPALAPELGPGSGDDTESERPSCSDNAYRRSSCRIAAIALFAYIVVYYTRGQLAA